MKMISNLWKTGVALLLCLSLLSGPVMASDLPDEEEPEVMKADSETEDQMENVKEADEEGEMQEEEAEEVKEEVEEVEEISEKETKEDVLIKNDQEIPDQSEEGTPSSTEESASVNEEPAIGTVVKSGDCGYVIGTMFYTVTYVGDGHYKLTISGTGKMLMIAVKYGAPWHNYSPAIVEIEIEDGVEGIREYAFYDCNLVTSLTIPASVNYIENGSFNMAGLRSVYFLGSYYEKFKANAFSGTTDVTVYHRNDLNWGDFTFTGTTTQSSDLALQTFEPKDPDCTTEGNLLYYYSETWDKFFSDEEAKQEIKDIGEYKVPALGHDWDDGTVTQQPTATEEGVMTYSCTRCDEIRTDAIPATGNEITPGDGDEIPDDEDGIPGDEEEIPDDQVPGSDLEEDDIEGVISINVNMNFQDKTGNGQAAGTAEQMEKTSAGQVKTADENSYVLYLVLLAVSGIALIALFRKRILR